jgi:hypothetical protein
VECAIGGDTAWGRQVNKHDNRALQTFEAFNFREPYRAAACAARRILIEFDDSEMESARQ